MRASRSCLAHPVELVKATVRLQKIAVGYIQSILGMHVVTKGTTRRHFADEPGPNIMA